MDLSGVQKAFLGFEAYLSKVTDREPFIRIHYIFDFLAITVYTYIHR